MIAIIKIAADASVFTFFISLHHSRPLPACSANLLTHSPQDYGATGTTPSVFSSLINILYVVLVAITNSFRAREFPTPNIES